MADEESIIALLRGIIEKGPTLSEKDIQDVLQSSTLPREVFVTFGAPQEQTHWTWRKSMLNRISKDKCSRKDDFFARILPSADRRDSMCILVTGISVACYKERTKFLGNLSKSKVHAARDAGLSVAAIMEQCHTEGFVAFRHASTRAPRLHSHGLSLVESIAYDDCKCNECGLAATHICSACDISVLSCADHRRKTHGLCDGVYAIDSINISLSSSSLRHLKPDPDLLVGVAFVPQGSFRGDVVARSRGMVVVTALDTTNNDSAKWNVNFLRISAPGVASAGVADATGMVDCADAMQWPLFLSHYKPFSASCKAMDDVMALSESFVIVDQGDVMLPLRGMFVPLNDDTPTALRTFLRHHAISKPLLLKLQAALYPKADAQEDDDDRERSAGHRSTDPVNAALTLLLNGKIRLAYAANIPTLPTLGGVSAASHLPGGDDELTKLDKDPAGTIPIKFGKEVMHAWDWSNPSHPSAGVHSYACSWADGAGIGRPMIFLHPPNTIGGFGIHAEQRNIESINITSDKLTHPVVWQFVSFTQRNTLRLARLQDACSREDRKTFYKNAFPKASHLDSKYTVLRQDADDMVGGRAYHWGLSLGKVAEAHQYTSTSWMLLDVSGGNEVPTAGDNPPRPRVLQDEPAAAGTQKRRKVFSAYEP